MKNIIKINTIKPKVKIGDIVQFNDLDPVRAVKFTDCDNCVMNSLEKPNACLEPINYCNYFEDAKSTHSNEIMFKAIRKNNAST